AWSSSPAPTPVAEAWAKAAVRAAVTTRLLVLPLPGGRQRTAPASALGRVVRPSLRGLNKSQCGSLTR
ncbi:hypothetical protein ABZ642_12375, partial [Streptomyces sp. NPDC007157]|uniref:hypothetical protein n=1 Tax=Streptomyces sp. NPDC007157 TaxID=3154681 RepID=UPI0033DADFAD